MTRMRRARRTRGMSLIEMMLVLAVLGILMSIGVGSYRRMQTNSLFTNEVSRLGGEIRNLGAAARAFGVMEAGLNPLNNEALRAEVTFAPPNGWVWRTVEKKDAATPAKTRQEGKFGQRQSVFARWSNAYNYRKVLTQGVWLEMGPVNGAPLMQIIFEPDGTPIDAGSVVLTNRSQTYTITITKLGSIQGP